ncbi:hypothetical protein PR048_009815 [Dryococelus australis]|uniref:Uncharacterized protein n=1 Tax=Dryococelus australis TaxID=614101 RepID=A0ABQ9I102_9NEOP|nr:hypothetical protein PR048_009815 [Dryococelus australis]
MMPPISCKSLFDTWVENRKDLRFDAMFDFVLQQVAKLPPTDTSVQSIKATVGNFSQIVYKKWEKVARHREQFLNYYSTWLQENIKFSEDVFEAQPCTAMQESASNMPGRPNKPFSACGLLKLKGLLDSVSQEELSMATEMTLRTGKEIQQLLLKNFVLHPQKEARKSLYQKPEFLSTDEALAVIVDTNLSPNDYKCIRQWVKDINCKCFQPYYKVKESKLLCYTPGIVITENSAEIALQSLIDHTVTRLCHVQHVLETQHLLETKPLNIIIKWGCEGAVQSKYKQNFCEDNLIDRSLFSSSMAPLQMYSGTEEFKTILWQNPAPSSTTLYRPIKFLFAKESVKLITTEVGELGNKLQHLCLQK